MLKKINNFLGIISTCLISLLICCVIMMLVMILTQTGYYLTYDVWYGSATLVIVELVIELVRHLIEPEWDVEEKERA